MEQGNKQRSRVSTVMDGLIRGIVEGEYGTTLPPQDVLSKAFGVSRTVMREALSMLLVRDMLDVRPKTGTRIRPMHEWRMIDDSVVSWRFGARPDTQLVRDAAEFRRLLEPQAAALAAMRATPADIAAIRTAFTALNKTPPSDASHHAAYALVHTRIVAASGNQIFQQMTVLIQGALSMAANQAGPSALPWEHVLKAHERLIDAIERHDSQAAYAASLALTDDTAPADSGIT
ncbi:FadR/GntR family transcriptional regulator [Paraburkholderia hayleyella]|uniref:FadR/GntR family transcriptional regulator n=1 Tax=Paraburkholderia hayleyella TaxID=2152889 RepID=UPI001290E4DB|nr:FCD domain-containing protein [Paraburkholderia hayleyella]